MWVVDVELHGLKQVLDNLLLSCVSIQQELASSADKNLDVQENRTDISGVLFLQVTVTKQSVLLYLTSNSDLLAALEAIGTLLTVLIVENYSY